MNIEINPVRFFKVLGSVIAICLVTALLVIRVPLELHRRAENQKLLRYEMRNTTSAPTPAEAAEILLGMFIHDHAVTSFGKQMELTECRVVSSTYNNQRAPIVPAKHTLHMVPSRIPRESAAWTVTGAALLRSVPDIGSGALPLLWSMRVTKDSKKNIWRHEGITFTSSSQR